MPRSMIICAVCGKKHSLMGNGMCEKCYMKAYHKSHKDKKAMNDKQRRIDNPGENSKKCRKYRETHKSEVAIQKKKYRESNKEKLSNYFLEYYKIHGEEKRIYGRKKYDEQPQINFLGKSYPLLKHERAPNGYVWHHTCYDHADPEANIVLITNSSHGRGHSILRKLGISIPHINEVK